MKWWESKKDGETEEIRLPNEIQEQLDQVKGLKTTVDEQAAKLSKLDGIEQMLTQMRTEQQDRNKPKPTAKTDEEVTAENEEISALLLTNPREAYARLAAHTNAGYMTLAAQNAKREVFTDQPEQFKYYTGEIKDEVDKILSAQTLAFQANPEAIKNTYFTVLGRFQDKIMEGKIKDRFAVSSMSRGSTVAPEKDKKKIDSNDDIRKIARQLGMKEEDYIKLLEEDAERYI
jgi:hypothetical protein